MRPPGSLYMFCFPNCCCKRSTCGCLCWCTNSTPSTLLVCVCEREEGRREGWKEGQSKRAREQARGAHPHLYPQPHPKQGYIPPEAFCFVLCLPVPKRSHMMMRAPRFSILGQCARSQDTTYGHTKFMQANLDMHIAHCAQEMIVKSVSSHVH
jgi:hypothetical protein